MDLMRISWTHDSVNILYNENQPSNLKYDGPMINFCKDPCKRIPTMPSVQENHEKVQKRFSYRPRSNSNLCTFYQVRFVKK